MTADMMAGVAAEEEVTELKRMGDVDKVERTGAKFEKTAPRPATSAEEGGQPARRLSAQAWSRTLGTRGEDSTHAFAWFAPSTRKQHRSLASAIGAEPPGRSTFADTSANVGRGLDARDRRRRQREREDAREKRRCVRYRCVNALLRQRGVDPIKLTSTDTCCRHLLPTHVADGCLLGRALQVGRCRKEAAT